MMILFTYTWTQQVSAPSAVAHRIDVEHAVEPQMCAADAEVIFRKLLKLLIIATGSSLLVPVILDIFRLLWLFCWARWGIGNKRTPRTWVSHYNTSASQ